MKLTETVSKRIVESIEDSKLPLSRIAASCDITDRTLRNWLRDGEDYKQQLEDGKIKKSDLNTNQKRKLDLFLRVRVARTNVESGYLKRIQEIAEKKEDIRAFQWLLRIRNKIYREADVDEDTTNGSMQVVVVNLSDSEGDKLLTEFMNGSATNAEEEDKHTKDTGDSEKS